MKLFGGYMGQVLDLNVFKPEPRTFRLLDGEKIVREIDVSRVPTDSVISILANMDMLMQMQKGIVDEKSFNMLLDVAVKTCQANDETVGRQWLLDNLDIFELVELILFTIQPVMDRLVESNENTKKKKIKT